MYLGEAERGSLFWVGLSQDKDAASVVVIAVIKLRVHEMLGNYRRAIQLVASRVAVSSVILYV
jgi:hypothetical protein